MDSRRLLARAKRSGLLLVSGVAAFPVSGMSFDHRCEAPVHAAPRAGVRARQCPAPRLRCYWTELLRTGTGTGTERPAQATVAPLHPAWPSSSRRYSPAGDGRGVLRPGSDAAGRASGSVYSDTRHLPLRVRRTFDSGREAALYGLQHDRRDVAVDGASASSSHACSGTCPRCDARAARRRPRPWRR